MVNYFLIEDNIFIHSDIVIVIDFVNLKIKLTQSFRCVHKDRMCYGCVLNLFYASKK
jgi:hypothetical protein